MEPASRELLFLSVIETSILFIAFLLMYQTVFHRGPWSHLCFFDFYFGILLLILTYQVIIQPLSHLIWEKARDMLPI